MDMRRFFIFIRLKFKIHFKFKGYFKVNFKDKVKGFRAPGATYFLLSEKKVGQESGLPGRQGQKRWFSVWVAGFVVGAVVLIGYAGTGAIHHYTAGVGGFVVRPMMASALLVLVSAVTGFCGHDIAPLMVSWWA
ncbi:MULTISPECIES: hypothetical protein [Cupriavidus]